MSLTSTISRLMISSNQTMYMQAVSRLIRAYYPTLVNRLLQIGLLMVQCQLSRVATTTHHLAMASDVEIRAVEIIVTYPPTILTIKEKQCCDGCGQGSYRLPCPHPSQRRRR